MAFYIFDFDGTIANCEHRRHHIEKRDWDGFFEACDLDPPIEDTLSILKDLVDAGHEVEIWSGRSAAVEDKSKTWLAEQGVQVGLLKRMRPVGDFTPDEKLKRGWLHEERAKGREPIAVFDDRQKVVDMWRAEGVPCYQVNAGDFDSPTRVNPNYLYREGGVPLLTILIGPAGAGKTTLAREKFDPQTVVSSDQIRKFLTGSYKDQSRNTDVFTALHHLVAARLAVGLPTVVDATNIRRADRRKLVGLAPVDQRVAYLVVDRKLEEIEKTAGADRLDVFRHNRAGKRESMIARMDQTFRSNMKDIMKGDDMPNVDVFMGWQDYASVLDERAEAFFAAGGHKPLTETMDQAVA